MQILEFHTIYLMAERVFLKKQKKCMVLVALKQ